MHITFERTSATTFACLATLYGVWGSTYLAIRVAVTSVAPLQMAAIRFLAAGALLYLILRARGSPAPTSREWRSSLVIGLLMMSIGLGGASVALTRVSSGMAALVFGSVPLWTLVFECLLGTSLRSREALGMLLGFGGLTLVAARGQLHADPVAAMVLAAAAASYSVGCVLSRRLVQAPGAMSVAAQMLLAGAALLVSSIVRGERLPAHVSFASAVALGHLVVFGSMLAYTALNHLLRTTRPSLATSYAFVNPVVALGLGALFAHEAVGAVELVAVVLVAAGVVVVASASTGRVPVRSADVPVAIASS